MYEAEPCVSMLSSFIQFAKSHGRTKDKGLNSLIFYEQFVSLFSKDARCNKVTLIHLEAILFF